MDKQIIINYTLQHDPKQTITPMKLQKLLYYIKVWSLIAGTPLYDGEFCHWDYGPVDEEVYHQYKHYGRQSIPVPETPALIDNPESEILLDFILTAYQPHSAYTLSAMTHQELPWLNTARNAIIKNSDIINYYQQHTFAQNFNPFDPQHKPFYPVQSNTWHAFTMDMNPEDAEQHTQFSSFASYKQELAQAQQELQHLFENTNW